MGMGKESILLIAVVLVELSPSLLFTEKMKKKPFLTCCLLNEKRQPWKFLNKTAFCYKYPCKDGNSSCRIPLSGHFSEITPCQIVECFKLQRCELPDSPFRCKWKFTMKPSDFRESIALISTSIPEKIIEELTIRRGRNELVLIIPEAKDLQHEIDLLMEKKECSRYMLLN
eukprot:m.214497 g.214497  ORF g.214497 m.214497 type:complete len:171 (+) comp39808_c0_seq74:258-770(+)